MSCKCYLRSSYPCQSSHHPSCCTSEHFADVNPCLHDEPVAPNLSLGNRILWLTEDHAASGIVRWIGRIPSISAAWTAGIEFDKAIPDGGNGDFGGRRFFMSRIGHSLFLPVSDLLKVDDNQSSHSSERSSFFSRLQGHRKCRDATYGHYKPENCSNFAHYDSVCSGCSSGHTPVYDRITSRRSKHYEEMYNASHTNPSFTPSNRLQVAKVDQNHPHTHSRMALDQNISRVEGSREEVRRKESLFNPRSSLRLIYDLKEWVSCLVTGTNRRRPKKKIVFEDGKSVTSFYFARGARDSRSITGERLSSFAEYASINVTKTSNPTKKARSNNSTKSGKSRKKRPAPLPPIPDKNFHSLKSVHQHDSHPPVVSESRSKTNTQKSTRETNESKSFKRRHKKRKAPTPPILPSIHSEIGSVLSLIEHAKVAQNNFKWSQNGIMKQKTEKGKSRNASKTNQNMFFARNSVTVSDSEHSGEISSSSFSADDSDEREFLKYNQMKGKKGSVQRSSSFMKYADAEHDVCLKISVQKTQTNVVTVEELPNTVRYTIEDSSSSELTEEEGPLAAPITYSVKHVQEGPKVTLSDSSSGSVEEANDRSRTIFEELQLKSPAKGSVKEFIQAFNMLADKGDKNYSKQIHSNGGISEQNAIDNCKVSPSVPTKWEYQNNNKMNNFFYSSNQQLLPIAEESNATNEMSEPGSSGITSKRSKGRNKSENGPSYHLLRALEKNLKLEDSLPARKHSSLASAVALSSLLSGTSEMNEEAATDSLKSPQQLDKPIMVGLYIENKSSHRGPLPLLVTPSMTLQKLKKQVESEYSFPRQQQCWIFGESFAVQDEASLASYGVTKPGCSILLYVISKESKSLPPSSRYKQQSSSISELNETCGSKTPKKVENLFVAEKKKGGLENSYLVKESGKEDKNQIRSLNPTKKSEFHSAWESDFEKRADYHSLVALDDVDLVSNVEPFECPVCMINIAGGEGVILQDCLHSFCKECLGGSIQYSDTALIKCPFRNVEYSCESHLQEREIKYLVTQEIYEKHLQRSMALAESQALDSFHCKTPDCPGWCLFEDNVNSFVCPVCKKTNCLTCAAIHEGKNCKQYQDYVAFTCDTNDEAKKTKEYLQNMVQSGEAMECPQCQVILMKKWGCDWLKCSMCHTEVCWVTKGPRWGPKGKGDTSGGCKCMLNGVRCHPKCSYCH